MALSAKQIAELELDTWHHGWKILDAERGSFIIGAHAVGHRLYPPKEVVEPAEFCGPLAVFRDVSSAAIFRAAYGHHYTALLVPCKYLPSSRKGLWRGTVDGDFDVQTCKFPSGTQFAQRVFCLE